MSNGDRLEISLLGEFGLRRGGETCALPPSRKTRGLLAYLVLNPGRHRREKLCELLWQVPDDPRGSLRWSLSKLRALMDGEGVTRIRADREAVEVDLTGVAVDLLEIRQRLADGCAGVDSAELAGMAQALSRGVLAGLEIAGQPEFDIFLAAEREQARLVLGAILRSLVQRSGEDRAGAIGLLQQLVEIEPYDYQVHLQLVESLAAAGRGKDARRQCERSVAALDTLDDAQRRALQLAAGRKPVLRDAGPFPAAPDASGGRQEVRFCRAADGAQIAYATVGEGPPLLKTANWLNHLEYDWDSPVWRHIFSGLADGRQLIRYDARGNGLSDWDVAEFSFQSMVSDLEAVVAATGLARFPLLGISQGCAVGVEYAVRHPEKVSRLILIGGYARGWALADSADYVEQTRAMLALIRSGWGRNIPAFRQLFTSLFMPDAPAENQQWFNELQRISTRPENAARLLEELGTVDVRPRLAEVKAPTLVLHARRDKRVPFTAGRELAGGIPGARFVSLDSSNHLMPRSDPAWPRLLREINAFLAE